MGFRGEAFVFDSPAAAVAGVVARLGKDAKPRSCETLPLADALGRILAESAFADRDSPAFDYAAMDGYALRAADLRSAADAGVRLRVVGESRIGSEPPRLAVGPVALRIATGAALPAGADTVIRREDVTEHSDGSASGVDAVSISLGVAAKTVVGEHIRRRGENTRGGAEVLRPGVVLSPTMLGTLAAIGVARPRVFTRLKIAIIATGDELVPPEASPSAFSIRNSNAVTLQALLGRHAWMQVESCTHVTDDGSSLRDALQHAIATSDAVVLSGGVSMGHRDPVRNAVEEASGEVIFHGLPQRPGKPMLAAVVRRADGTNLPLFGLPGNPISAMVTCTRIVVPVLALHAGAVRPPFVGRIALATFDGKTLPLWWHRLVRINGDGAAELVDGKGSGDIIAGGASDGFIEVPPAASQATPPCLDGPALFHFYPWST